MKKLLFVPMLALFAASAQATTGLDIVIDFGNHSTSTNHVNNICPAGTDSENGTYNLNWTSGTLTDFTTGSTTSVTTTITSASNSSMNFRSNPSYDYIDAWGGSTGGWLTSSLASDFIYGTVDGSWLTTTINGLTAGASYKISLVSGADSSYSGASPYTCRIKANDAYASTETGSATKTYGNGWDATVEGSTNYLTWDSVTADSNGKIAISLADISGDDFANIFLNGLRLTSNPVPEPSETAAALGILALAGAFLWRKKKAAR